MAKKLYAINNEKQKDSYGTAKNTMDIGDADTTKALNVNTDQVVNGDLTVNGNLIVTGSITAASATIVDLTVTGSYTPPV